MGGGGGGVRVLVSLVHEERASACCHSSSGWGRGGGGGGIGGVVVTCAAPKVFQGGVLQRTSLSMRFGRSTQFAFYFIIIFILSKAHSIQSGSYPPKFRKRSGS